ETIAGPATGVDDETADETAVDTADETAVDAADGSATEPQSEVEAEADMPAVVETATETKGTGEAATLVAVAPAESLPIEPDAVLLGSREVARAALAEITDAQTIGADDGHEVHEAHVLTLYFECRLPGYPGWRWAATLAR